MKKFAIAAAAAALTLGLAAAPASAAGVKVGVLTCHVSSGWGFVFGSSKDLRCNYRPNSGEGEHYVGEVKKFGVDLGYTEGGELIWGVIAPTSSLKRGALEGGYGGATASAAVGVGVGANVLVGGFDRSITLQPLSVEGMKGVNVAAGIGAIDLKYAP
jgi:opacity protein-like surface antigen